MSSSRAKRKRDLSSGAFGFVARDMPTWTKCAHAPCPLNALLPVNPTDRKHLMVGPQVTEGTPDLYCRTCFCDSYVPENLEKFIAESGPLQSQHDWAAVLHHRYYPLPRAGAFVDFQEERWKWAGSWIETTAVEAIFKREALAMASFLQHYPFIVTVGVQIYRSLRLQAASGTRQWLEDDPFPCADVNLSFPVGRLDRKSGSTIAACATPGIVGIHATFIDVTGHMCVVPCAKVASSKGQWVAEELGAGRLSDCVITLAQCGQADILALLLDRKVDWNQVPEQHRPLAMAQTAILCSDAATTVTRLILEIYPEVAAALFPLLLSSRDTSLVKQGLAVKNTNLSSEGNDVKRSLQVPFGVFRDADFNYECCKLIINAHFLEELSADSIGKTLPAALDWSELLPLMLHPERDPVDPEGFGKRFAEMHEEKSFVSVLKLITDVHCVRLPTTWIQDTPTEVKNFLPLAVWDWIVHQIEAQTSTTETVDLTQLVALLHNNSMETVDVEALDMWDRVFSRCPPDLVREGDAADELEDFPKTMCTPLGAAIALQSIEVVEKLVSYGAELKVEHLMLAITFFVMGNADTYYPPTNPGVPVTEDALLALTRLCSRSSKFDINLAISWQILSRSMNFSNWTTPLALLVRSPLTSPELVRTLIVNFGARTCRQDVSLSEGTHFRLGRSRTPVNKDSPLHVAVLASVVAVLLEQHGTVNAQTERTRETPLHCAIQDAKTTDIDTSRLVVLLQNNATLSANVNGDTPLHLAAAKGWGVGLMTLLAHFHVNGTLKASLNLKNKKKETVLDLATARKDAVLIGMIIPYGANHGAE